MASKLLKSISISEVTVLLNEGTTDEKTVTEFRVLVLDQVNDDSTEEGFATLEEAKAYAADVATRPLMPYVDLFQVR